MRPVFVVGATGLTGRAVVAALGERGVATVAHVRPDSSKLDEWRQRFEALGGTVDATPWDEQAMTERLRELRPAAVLSLLGTTAKRGRAARNAGKPEESYETVDYGLTALLLRAAIASGVEPRFVYLSSMGASATTGNAYLRARGRVEADLRQSGLPWIAARPSFIVGERDERRPGESVGAATVDAALGVVGALGGRRLRERYRSTTNERLAAALVELALDPEAPSGVVESDALQARGRDAGG